MGLLRKYFRPEFLNRIDEIIIFHALTQEQIKEIVKLQLERVKRVAKGQGINLVFDDSVISYLAKIGYQPEFGARELKRKIRTELETRLAEEMIKGEIVEHDNILVLYDEKEGKIKFEKIKEEIKVEK
jgi:ATP-dependent Clp protease ATP-binding subunit ClpC